MIWSLLAFAAAFFFAANIGASGTAASMGSAYGSGAVKSRRMAVILVAAFAVLGAVTGGGEVVTTISKGIVPSSVITAQVTTIILTGACLTLFIANRIGIPLSTSEVTVGSIVGVGLAVQHIYGAKLAFIVSVWIVLPFLSYGIAYGIGKWLVPKESRWMGRNPVRTAKILTVLLLGAGCYEAYSAGMNNIANAVGPLIGASVIGLSEGIWIGALFMAAGAILMGGKVLETNGKKITTLSLLQGSIVSFTGGTLVVIASFFGIPVPLTQATTMAIIGVGVERKGIAQFREAIVKKILLVWFVSPVASLAVSMFLYRVFIDGIYELALLLPAAAIVLVTIHRLRRGSRLSSRIELE